MLLAGIKGPDNSTCQLLPTSSQRKVKMGWEGQERDKRWWRIGVCVCARNAYRSEVYERLPCKKKVLLVKGVCAKAKVCKNWVCVCVCLCVCVCVIESCVKVLWVKVHV